MKKYTINMKPGCDLLMCVMVYISRFSVPKHMREIVHLQVLEAGFT